MTQPASTAHAAHLANSRAIGIMALSMALLAANDAIIKLVGASMPVTQIMGVRGAMLCVVLAVACRLGRQSVSVRGLVEPWALVRGACEFAAAFAFFTSLRMVPIAVATTLALSSPLILTALAGPLFAERVGPWRWAAVAAGFAGVLIIAAPGTGAWRPALLVPLAAAFAVAARDVATRRVPREVSSGSVTLTTALGVTAGAVGASALTWQPVAAPNLAWLALAAVIVGASFLGQVVAVRLGELSVVAPIQYLNIPCAVALGAAFWNEVPEAREIAGGLVIVGANLLILHRERVHHLRPAHQERGRGESVRPR